MSEDGRGGSSTACADGANGDMKRIRIDRPKIRRERLWLDDLPADPRDPDVVRAKALARAREAAGSAEAGRRPDRDS